MMIPSKIPVTGSSIAWSTTPTCRPSVSTTGTPSGRARCEMTAPRSSICALCRGTDRSLQARGPPADHELVVFQVDDDRRAFDDVAGDQGTADPGLDLALDE